MAITSAYRQTEFPEWLQKLIEDLYKESARIRKMGMGKEGYPSYDLEKRIAGLPDDLKKAIALAQKTGDFEPFIKQAQEHVQAGTMEYPENYERYMNPYQKAVIDKLIAHTGRGLKEEILPALSQHYAGLGQWGSTRHEKMRERAALKAQEALQQQIDESLARGFELGGERFEKARARDIEAARIAPELGKAAQVGRLADVTTLGNIGELQRAEDQARKDLEYQEFIKQHEYPAKMLREQVGIIEGIPRSESELYAQQSPNQPRGDTFANIGSMLTSLAPVIPQQQQQQQPQQRTPRTFRTGFGLFRKEGGNVKKPRGIAGHPFVQSSLYKKPKVGQKNTLYKGAY